MIAVLPSVLHPKLPFSDGLGGIYIGHAYNITINSKAKIGRNCNIHKGIVIGQANRGSRKGCPTIGDRVWIGINSAVVGNITIGDDVMIAPIQLCKCRHSLPFCSLWQSLHY